SCVGMTWKTVAISGGVRRRDGNDDHRRWSHSLEKSRSHPRPSRLADVKRVTMDRPKPSPSPTNRRARRNLRRSPASGPRRRDDRKTPPARRIVVLPGIRGMYALNGSLLDEDGIAELVRAVVARLQFVVRETQRRVVRERPQQLVVAGARL